MTNIPPSFLLGRCGDSPPPDSSLLRGLPLLDNFNVNHHRQVKCYLLYSGDQLIHATVKKKHLKKHLTFDIDALHETINYTSHIAHTVVVVIYIEIYIYSGPSFIAVESFQKPAKS